MTQPEPKTWEQLDIEASDERWWLPWIPRTEVLRQIRALWTVLSKVGIKLNEMEKLMADVSQVLNDVAVALRDNLGPNISALLAESAQLRAENAALKNEDAAESDAANNVKSAFDDAAALFNQVDEAPTPEPLPEPPAASDVDVSDVSGDGSTTA